MARYSRIAILLAFLSNLFGGSSAQADNRDVVVTLLHTNDLHGSVISQDGGLARIATVVKQIRADMPNVLLFDAGDIIHGSSEDYFSGGHATISAMNTMGYNAATTGNHDYDFGLDAVQGMTDFANFPFLAANVHAASGGQWNGVEQYKIFTVDGIRIGVLGLTTLETVTLHWPGSIKDIKVEDPIVAATALISKVKLGSDVLIVLSHLGINQDYALAKTVPGIDFIIGAHTHTVIDKLKRVGNTVIGQTGAYGRALGRIDFIVRQDGNGLKIASINGVDSRWYRLKNPPLGKVYPKRALIRISRKFSEDDAVMQAYLPYQTANEAHIAEVIASAPSSIPGRGSCSPASYLVADAVRALACSDVAFVDTRSVASCGLPAGSLTVKSAFDLIEGFTRQNIVVGKISGQDLSDMISNNLSVLAISGATVEYQMHRHKPKITQLLIGNKPVDPTGNYTIAMQAFVMMRTMSKYPRIEIAAELQDTTREAVVNYLKAQKIISMPSGERAIRRRN